MGLTANKELDNHIRSVHQETKVCIQTYMIVYGEKQAQLYQEKELSISLENLIFVEE